MDNQQGHTGCDLRETCGFFCDSLYLYRQSESWKVMIANYCEGANFPLCARRSYYLATGTCAPWDMIPVGSLPADLLPKLFPED